MQRMRRIVFVVRNERDVPSFRGRKNVRGRQEDERMIKTVLAIDGMMCGMCEAHINDVIRKNFEVRKVSSSHSKGRTEILSEEPIPEEALHQAIGPTGYRLTAVSSEPFEKKRRLFGKTK